MWTKISSALFEMDFDFYMAKVKKNEWKKKKIDMIKLKKKLKLNVLKVVYTKKKKRYEKD